MAQIAVLYAPNDRRPPEPVDAWLHGLGMPLSIVRSADELMALALRGRPRVVVLDARQHPVAALKTCGRLKSDSYTGIVPCVVVCRSDEVSFAAAFDAGADEVVAEEDVPAHATQRLAALLRRSDRDTSVHPSTRLPGTVAIEGEISRRLASRELFAVCYADLDHFKEFNDRYSYYDGDRVIRILAKILHDVVKGLCGEEGFIGHIGGDDFIFVIPAPAVAPVCGEIVSIFDALIPYQYSEQDRRAGYYFGKDRRGQLHRVPLMTVSIGVVTNERRHFTHPHQVSELATEMKSYAKTLPGSVYTIDRRHDPSTTDEPNGASRRSDPLGVGEQP
ncbi:MAG TPA: GGDEF domain-containing protein [Gemmatimonadaceae bacterium]|nr:GGDEF domain-containing protein [Gemmatimonadaceae bacterium]